MVADDMMDLQRAKHFAGKDARQTIRDNITSSFEMLGIRRPGDKLGRIPRANVD
jgi:hypothetical protein